MEPRIIKAPGIKHPFDNVTLGEFFFSMSKTHGEKIAQIDSVTDQKESFNSVRRRSVRAAIEMSKRGITSKDTIVFCTINCMDNIIPLVGATYLGAKVASLDPTLSVNNVRHLLTIVKPTMIFVEVKSINLIEQAIESLQKKPMIVVFGDSSKYPTLEDFTKIAENEDNFIPTHISPDETALIFFSSGTTGLPKAVCLSSKGLLYSTVNFNFKIDSLLHFTTLYWGSGVYMTIASFYGGGYRIIVPEFDVKDTFRIIEKYKVTYALTAPLLCYKLTNFEDAEHYDTSSLDVFMIGGGSISSAQLQRTHKLFKNSRVVIVYGMTEVGFTTFFQPKLHSNYIKTKPESCGKLIPGVMVKVVEVDTRHLLPPYQKGEICVKSPGVMLGYYNTDTSHIFDEDGFLKTGDIGYYDKDECFYIVERIKEMFKYQSWHIVPSVIESVLLEHPAIAEACVFGVPHEEDGDVPAAAVVLKDGRTATSEEIAQFVAQSVLDRERLRAGVVIVESLPKTPTGKIVRQKVKDLAMKYLSNK